MKPFISKLIVGLFAVFCVAGLSESTARAGGKSKANSSQTSKQPKASASLQALTPVETAWNFQVPYYLIQVEYARPSRPGYGGYGGHGGGGRPRYRFFWYTIAETTDLEEAEFIYALFELGYEQGVLDEIAPDLGFDSFPTRVRMITEYRTVEPVLTAE